MTPSIGFFAAAALATALGACSAQTPYQQGYTQGCRVGQSYSGAPAISTTGREENDPGEAGRGFRDGIGACFGSIDAYARAARGGSGR